MKLRYYEWDPRCGEFTIWDGSSCQPDYLTYCDSLTSDYQKETGDDQAYVFWNGTVCVLGSKQYKEEEPDPSTDDNNIQKTPVQLAREKAEK